MKVIRCEVCDQQSVIPGDRRPFPCMRCTVTSIESAMWFAFMQDVSVSDDSYRYWNEAPEVSPDVRRQQ